MQVLIVVDMQKDFIDGALGSKEAQAIVPAAIEKIRLRKEEGWEILYTRDTHWDDYLTTPEGKKLPVPHCIKGTEGWQIPKEIYVDGCPCINKPTFGYTGWQEYSFDRIELIGLCTDICVVSNAMLIKAMLEEADLVVDSALCAGVTPDKHEAALETMRSCQITVL